MRFHVRRLFLCALLPRTKWRLWGATVPTNGRLAKTRIESFLRWIVMNTFPTCLNRTQAFMKTSENVASSWSFFSATFKSRRQKDFATRMLVYCYRKGRGSRAQIRGQWHGPTRVLFQEKSSDGERANQGSLVWISHGTVLLRCAPEQLQPVGRDVMDIDKEENGPFSPDEFLKGSLVYQDLFGEKHVLEEQVTGDEDLAWHHNPDDMRLIDDVEEN